MWGAFSKPNVFAYALINVKGTIYPLHTSVLWSALLQGGSLRPLLHHSKPVLSSDTLCFSHGHITAPQLSSELKGQKAQENTNFSQTTHSFPSRGWTVVLKEVRLLFSSFQEPGKMTDNYKKVRSGTSYLTAALSHRWYSFTCTHLQSLCCYWSGSAASRSSRSEKHLCHAAVVVAPVMWYLIHHPAVHILNPLPATA